MAVDLTLLTLLQRATLPPTRTAAALPPGADLAYHCTVSRPLKRTLDEASQQTSDLLLQLLRFVAPDGPTLASVGTDNFADIVSVVDGLLEHSDLALDLAAGKCASNSVGPDQLSVQHAAPIVRASHTLAKPQLRFHEPVDNARDAGPWIPLLRDKPHALTPLDLTPRSTRFPASADVKVAFTVDAVPHPYAQEIEAARLQTRSQRPFIPSPAVTDGRGPSAQLAGRPCTHVASVSALDAVIELLKRQQAVAVDLEHHDHRTYRGITCLMQISTIEEDFIVDVLQPDVRSAASSLNEVFANPSIIKVLHGAHRDIIWLERDLGIYVVNLFDTYEASKVLNLPRASLAYLLQHYISFSADKRFQLADWRIRPLSLDMAHYARSDTAFLLAVYRELVTELLDADDGITTPSPLARVIDASAATAGQAYVPVPYEAERRWERLLDSWRAGYDAWSPANHAVFRALHDWRDLVARELDESPLFILSNASLMAMAQAPPTTASELGRLLPRNPVMQARTPEILSRISIAMDSCNGPSETLPVTTASLPQPAVGRHYRYDAGTEGLFSSSAVHNTNNYAQAVRSSFLLTTARPRSVRTRRVLQSMSLL